MKTRLGYVSNSSSSSFFVAYDKKVFGDLLEFFRKYHGCFGCETGSGEENIDYLFGEDYPYENDENAKRLVEEARKRGMSFLNVSIDHDCVIGVSKLLQQINEAHGGDKMIFIDDGSDY